MKKLGLIFLNFLLSLVGLAGIVLAHAGEDEYGHHSMMGGMMYGSYGPTMMFFGWIFSLLVVIVLILLIIWLIKQIQKK